MESEKEKRKGRRAKKERDQGKGGETLYHKIDVPIRDEEKNIETYKK